VVKNAINSNLNKQIIMATTIKSLWCNSINGRFKPLDIERRAVGTDDVKN
jgi:hypothetical protein